MAGNGSARNTRTTWLFDFALLAKSVASERTLRGVTLSDIERETGVNATQISTFLAGNSGLGIHGLVSLAKWSNTDLRSLVKRQRNVASHVMTPQERELRTLLGYLNAAGLDVQPDESPVDAAVRLLAQAKEQGLLDGDDDSDDDSDAE
jgi:transcriptional regulator with XRE-family HTH domain